MTFNKPTITLALMFSTAVLSVYAYPAMEADDVWRLIRTIRHPQELPAVVPQHHNLHQRYDYGQPQPRSKPEEQPQREASDYADYNDLMLLLDESRDAVDDYDLKKSLLSRQLGRGLSAPFFAASSRNSVPAVWIPQESPAEYDSGTGLWYDPNVQDGADSEDADGIKSSLTDMLNNLSENRNDYLEEKRSQRGQEAIPASVAVTTTTPPPPPTPTPVTATTTTSPVSGQKEVAIMRPAAPSRQFQYHAKMGANEGSSKRKMASNYGSSVITYQDDLTEELDNLKRTMN